MPPAAIAIGVGAAALGAAAAGGASASGVGKTRYNGQNYKQTGNYDPNRFQYGGQEGLADKTAGNFSAVKNQHQDQQKEMYGRGNASLNDATAVRANALNAAGRLDARAQGQNLISTRVADAARRNMGAATQSNIASARGPAGLALAQQDATAAGAQGNAAIADSEMTQGAQEQMMNERAAFDAYGNVRAGDVGQANTAFNASAQTGALGAQYGQLENAVRSEQNKLNLGEQQLAAQSHGQEQELLQDANARNAQTDMSFLKAGLGAMGGGASTAAAGSGSSGGTSDPKAKTDIKTLSKDWKTLSKTEGDEFVERAAGASSAGMARQRYGREVLGENEFDADDDLSFSENDFDADEYLESKFPKPYEREGQTQRHNTDAETIRVLKGDADQMMAGYRANEARGPAVQRTSDLQHEALAQRAEEIRRAQEELDLAMHQGLSAPAVNAKRDVFMPDLDPNRRDPLIRENPFGDERVAHASTPDSKFGVRSLDPSVAAAPATFDKLAADGSGGMDVMGSIKAHGEYGTRFVKNPTADVSASTPAAKTNISSLGGGAGSSLSGGSSSLGGQAAAPQKGGGDPDYANMALKDIGKAGTDTADAITTGGYQTRHVGWSMANASDPKAKDETKPLRNYAVSQETIKPLSEDEKRAMPWYRGPNPTEQVSRDQAARVAEAERATRAMERPETEERSLLDRVVGFVSGPSGDAILREGRRHDQERLARENPPASDPRAKQAAERLGGSHSNEVADTLDETPAVSYKYKSEYFEPDTTKPGERQAGFLTTDLKKTPLGAAVVEKRPDGYEGYNTHRMIGLQYAEIRNLHERMRDLEAQLASARGGRHG